MVLALSMSFRWSILTFRKLKNEKRERIIHYSYGMTPFIQPEKRVRLLPVQHNIINSA